MIVRRAEPNDFEAINSFDTFSGDRRKDIERGECFVGVEDERVVGYIVFNHSFFLMPFIQFLFVDPTFRQRGFAGKLLDYVEQACEGKKLFSSTESDNLIMLRVFEKRGYSISGSIENIQENSEIVFCKKMKHIAKGK